MGEGSETADEKKEQNEIVEAGKEDGDHVLVYSLEDEIDRKEESACCEL